MSYRKGRPENTDEGTDESDNGRRLPDGYAESEARRIWERADLLLEDESTLSDIGFADRSEVETVVVVIAAGDRLHPQRGFDFLGPGWRYMDEAECNRLLEERERAVKKIVDKVEHALTTEGFAAAQQMARTAAPFQVVFLSDSETATQAVVQHLLSMGLGTRELSNCDFRKRGNILCFQWAENLSYFCPGDYPLPGEHS